MSNGDHSLTDGRAPVRNLTSRWIWRVLELFEEDVLHGSNQFGSWTNDPTPKTAAPPSYALIVLNILPYHKRNGPARLHSPPLLDLHRPIAEPSPKCIQPPGTLWTAEECRAGSCPYDAPAVIVSTLLDPWPPRYFFSSLRRRSFLPRRPLHRRLAIALSLRVLLCLLC